VRQEYQGAALGHAEHFLIWINDWIKGRRQSALSKERVASTPVQRFVVIAAAITATMGTASAGSVTPAGCSTCTIDAQVSAGGATPFTLENLGVGTPNARQAINSPVSFPGETITFPAAGSGVYAGGTVVSGGLIRSPFGDANTTTNYLGAVPGDSGVTITFATPQHQFKLLWGTVDPTPATYNQVTIIFSDGAGVVNGADVAASFASDGLSFAPGNTNAAVVITTAQPFTSVTLAASEASFEFVPSVPVSLFSGTPGQANCFGQSVSTLASQYGGLNAAAAALDFAGVSALQNAIMGYCGG
jgi:hypothetical protein